MELKRNVYQKLLEWKKRAGSEVWTELFCLFIALCTSLGAYYHKIEASGGTVAMAVLLIPLYYIVCRAVICCGSLLLEKDIFQRRQTKGKLEAVLFSGNGVSFFVCMLIFLLCFLPYLHAFAPGTMEDDAYVQLCQYFGAREMTGHHPVIISIIMGKFIDFGQSVLGSQSQGLYLYIVLQLLLQILGFCYTLNILDRLQVPVAFRWLTLLFYVLLPIFPMWSCTLSKDTGYYIFMLFFVAALTDICAFSDEPLVWWKVILFTLGSFGVCLYRNNGRHVIMITILSVIFLYRRHIKMWLLVLLGCLSMVAYIDYVYMPNNGIREGSVKEMLSIPLQQTARYIKECYEDITEEEKTVLEAVFEAELRELGEEYMPEFADPVKEVFAEYPEDGLIEAYLKVWLRQFWKHPKVYVKAFINHVYGYFYIDRECVQDPMAVFTYVNFSQHWKDDNLEVEFKMENEEKRLSIENWFYALNELPVTRIFFRVSSYVLVLLGLCVNMLAERRGRQLMVMTPALSSLLVCMLSPVGTCLRYMLPIIVSMPVLIAWNIYGKADKKIK